MNAQGVEANVRAEPSQIGQKAPLTGQLQPPTGPGIHRKSDRQEKTLQFTPDNPSAEWVVRNAG